MSRILRFRRRKRPDDHVRPSVVERLRRIRQERRQLHLWAMVAGIVVLVGVIGWTLV